MTFCKTVPRRRRAHDQPTTSCQSQDCQACLCRIREAYRICILAKIPSLLVTPSTRPAFHCLLWPSVLSLVTSVGASSKAMRAARLRDEVCVDRCTLWSSGLSILSSRTCELLDLLDINENSIISDRCPEIGGSEVEEIA
jgi:hypothetical protein